MSGSRVLTSESFILVTRASYCSPPAPKFTVRASGERSASLPHLLVSAFCRDQRPAFLSLIIGKDVPVRWLVTGRPLSSRLLPKTDSFRHHIVCFFRGAPTIYENKISPRRRLVGKITHLSSPEDNGLVYSARHSERHGRTRMNRPLVLTPGVVDD